MSNCSRTPYARREDKYTIRYTGLNRKRHAQRPHFAFFPRFTLFGSWEPCHDRKASKTTKESVPVSSSYKTRATSVSSKRVASLLFRYFHLAMSSLLAGPNAVTPWIQAAVEERLRERNRGPPTNEGVPRLAQVIHRGDDASVRLSDGHCSISAYLSEDVQASLAADSFSLGCIVKVKGWTVTTQRLIATTTAIANQRASAATGDGLCLWVPQRLEIIGGRGLAKVGGPTEIHSSIPIRRILMSLKYNWDDIRERLKLCNEGERLCPSQQLSQESQQDSQLSQDSADGRNLGISAMLEPLVASDDEDDAPMEEPVMEEDPVFETQQPVCLQDSVLETQPQSQHDLAQAAEQVEDANQFQSQGAYEAACSVLDEPEFFTQNMDLLETNRSQQFADSETNTPEKDVGGTADVQDSKQKGETNNPQSNGALHVVSEDVASKSPLRYPVESGLVTHRRGSTGALPARFPPIAKRRCSAGGVESVHDLNLDVTLGSLPAKRKKRSWSNVKGSGIERLLSKCGFYPAKKLCIDLPCLPGDRIRKMLDA
eukprot:scaffold1428_cov159-Amphora_coffeaeformis.AAC.16